MVNSTCVSATPSTANCLYNHHSVNSNTTEYLCNYCNENYYLNLAGRICEANAAPNDQNGCRSYDSPGECGFCNMLLDYFATGYTNSTGQTCTKWIPSPASSSSTCVTVVRSAHLLGLPALVLALVFLVLN